MNSHNNNDRNNVNFLDLQIKFISNLKSKNKSTNTVKNYRTDLTCFKGFLEKKLSHYDIGYFGIPEIKEYGSYLQEKYKSSNSLRRRVQTLRIFFDYLVETGVFTSNPVKALAVVPKFLDIPHPTSFLETKELWNSLLLEDDLTSEGITKLISKRNQIIFLLIYTAGLKVSDLAKIKVDNILIKDDENIRVLIDHPKRDPYSIPLNAIFSKIFTQYKNCLEDEKKISKIEFPELLFNANAYKILSGGLSPRGIELVFKDFKSKFKIEVTPKNLRQSCIFTWLHQKKTDSLIKEWLGVAPSYSLGLFKKHAEQHVYSTEFICELYKQKTSK